MNTNTEAIIEKMSNNANTLTAAAATDGKGEISREALIGYLKKNLDLLFKAADLLTIAEAEEIMTELRDLECVLSDAITSRIPCNCLAKVEGKFYLLVTPDDNGPNGVEPNGVEKKLRAILAATFLEGLEGYAAQMLAETWEEEVRLADLAENPLYGDDMDDLARAVEYATERREALGTALAEIQRAIAAHGGKATATAAGLDSAVIESLVTACMANGAGREEGSDI